MPLDLHESSGLCRHDRRVKPELFLAHPKEYKNRRHEPQPVLVDIKLLDAMPQGDLDGRDFQDKQICPAQPIGDVHELFRFPFSALQ
jgi:hypothetical protein